MVYGNIRYMYTDIVIYVRVAYLQLVQIWVGVRVALLPQTPLKL